jgi:hypothetical protein
MNFAQVAGSGGPGRLTSWPDLRFKGPHGSVPSANREKSRRKTASACGPTSPGCKTSVSRFPRRQKLLQRRPRKAELRRTVEHDAPIPGMDGAAMDQVRLDDVSCNHEMAVHIGASEVVLEDLAYRRPPILTVFRVGGQPP